MIGDVTDAANALQNCLDKGTEMLRGRGRQIADGEDAKVTETIINAEATEIVEQTLRWKVVTRAMAYVRFDDIMNHHFGFDVGQTAWELIPYSFVVDYFINIGAWVSTLKPNIAGQFVGQCYSIKIEEEWHAKSHIDWHNSADQTVSGNHMQNCEGRLFLDSYIRVPSSRIPLPSFKPRLTLPKLIDIAALFVKGRINVNKILSR